METKFDSKFKENEKVDPLINFIHSNKWFIIASDGSKWRKVSDGAWAIVDEDGREILSEYNLDYEEINQINSHRAENYGFL